MDSPVSSSPTNKYKHKLHSPSTRTKPPFLRVAAEIRNKIYEFALTSDTGNLLYKLPGEEQTFNRILVDTNAEADPETGKIRQFNQLRMICCQLREETMDLELKYNVLNFTTRVYDEDNVRALRFSDSLKLERWKLHWISTVKISPCPVITTDPLKIMGRIQRDASWMARFCAENPHIHIKYIISSWTPFDSLLDSIDPNSFAKYGVFFAMLNHNVDLSYLLPNGDTTDALIRKAATWIPDPLIRTVNSTAPNMSVYPHLSDISVELKEDIRNNLLGAGYGAIETEQWFDLAEDWIKNGIRLNNT